MEEINLGAKVQEFRTVKQYSLRELAKKAGVTASMLSQIENNMANPSVNTLKAIASALEVPMFKFFLDNTVTEELIVRKDDYIRLGGVEDGVIYDLLTPDMSGTIEFCKMVVVPESFTAQHEKSHAGEEVAYVLNGAVRIYMDNRMFELSEGDSVKIPPGVKHRWENPHTDAAEIIFAITPPSF